MVRLSYEVETKLIDIYFNEFDRNPSTPQFWKMLETLRVLDKNYIQRTPGRYPSWQKGKYLEFQIGYFLFGYVFDGKNVIVQECYNVVKNENIENNRTLRLTEAQFKRMLTECITKIINEIA